MSLVSTPNVLTKDNSDMKSLTRNSSLSSFSSIYQVNGKPLSKEALYRSKLKHGIYQSPNFSANRSGVVGNASDAAANVATSSDLAIYAYKRLFVDSNASRAAVSAVSATRTKGNRNSVDIADSKSVNNNALFDHAVLKTFTSKVYKPHEKQQKKVDLLKSSEDKAVKDTTTLTHPLSGQVNLTKVLTGATKLAQQRIEERSNPSKTIYIKTSTNITTSAKVSLQDEEKSGLDFASYAASNAADNLSSKVLSSEEKLARSEHDKLLKQLTSNDVLAKAKNNVDAEMKVLDNEYLEKHPNLYLYSNDAFNRTAVEKATKLVEEENVKTNKFKNKVNLGGGLYLSTKDIDNIAAGIITPVLNEVSLRTLNQRNMDEEIKKRTFDYQEQIKHFNKLQSEKEINDRVWIKNAQEKQDSDWKEVKQVCTSYDEKLVHDMDAKVTKKQKLVADTKLDLETLKTELQKKLDDRAAEQKEEVKSLQKQHKKEIKQVKQETNQILQPFVDELEAVEAEYQTLVEKRDDINGHVEELQHNIEQHKVNIESLNQKIEETNGKHAEEQGNLSKLQQTDDELLAHINTVILLEAAEAKERASIVVTEAELKQAKIDAMINERNAERVKLDLDLKKHKWQLLENLQNLADIRNEGNLDEDKVRTLIGVTSKEFINNEEERDEDKALNESNKIAEKDVKETAVLKTKSNEEGKSTVTVDTKKKVEHTTDTKKKVGDTTDTKKKVEHTTDTKKKVEHTTDTEKKGGFTTGTKKRVDFSTNSASSTKPTATSGTISSEKNSTGKKFKIQGGAFYSMVTAVLKDKPNATPKVSSASKSPPIKSAMKNTTNPVTDQKNKETGGDTSIEAAKEEKTAPVKVTKEEKTVSVDTVKGGKTAPVKVTKEEKTTSVDVVGKKKEEPQTTNGESDFDFDEELADTDLSFEDNDEGTQKESYLKEVF
ncbi:Eis1p SCDLUD_004156 [Saccharomycodes ludwigii]|uniref:Eis1p n=1 Tax=Saccharomycodes ludwigii TaxID=36035 RepID=UPI001E861D8C|nr:hypothetical protein SCDLUD_004156 [Saccharomycodes ludwigii]KAH3899857.1 hypothetical protein SCDLUD_004156 [Saccharomycodes ludwigii]